MESRRAGPLAATALGVLCGTVGGVAAALLDYGLGASAARQFLPDGTGRLAAFLVGLYGAAGALAGGAAGLVLGLVARWTDGGALWRSGFGDAQARASRVAGLAPAPGVAVGRPLAAYAIAALAALALHGVAVRFAAIFALTHFHSPMLIAALIGAEAAALAVPAALCALALAALLGLVLPFGPRLRPSLRVAPGLLVVAWTVGLGVGAAVMSAVLAALQHKARMTPPLRALNAGLAAPPVIAGAVALEHVLARVVAPRLPRGLRALAERPVVVAAVPVVLVAAAAVALAWADWSVARALPLRALAVAAAAPLVALCAAIAEGPRALVRRGPAAGRVAAVVAVPLSCALLALQAGRVDRVHKAATIHASLAAILLEAGQRGWDLDGDGFSPLFGADCNDLDAAIHPGALDWPDDGIDQNCNGHQASAARPARPPFPSIPDAVPRRPNVLLITIDALRWDHVGAYGYARATTPRIDELARESVVFKSGWAHSPSTRYSVPAILTGRYESTIAWGSPREHWPPRVLDENRLISEMLREHGYHTAALTPTHYFEPTWNLIQGFDDYDNSLAVLHHDVSGDPKNAVGSSARPLGDLGVRWLERHAATAREKPFFLWMHFYDPHYLYEAHPDCAECRFGDPDHPSDVDLYDGEVRFTDREVGRVLDAVRGAGAWDDTVVIVSADHGEGFGEHGVKLHGYHIYSAQNHVPFIVRVPGIPPRAVEEPVGHVDLFPSLLNVLRAPAEPQLLGRSFLDLMLGGSDPRLVFGEVDFEGPTQRKSVASRTHHLVANTIPDGTFELYDLLADPLEAHDLFAHGAGGEQQRLLAALGEWMDEGLASRIAGHVATRPFPVERPLDADLGGMLVVDGVNLRPAGVVRAGDVVEVELVLHARRPVAPGWRMFTHALGPGGRSLNLDHDLIEGLVPLPLLAPGQWVRDRVRVPVPPDWRGTTVHLSVGLFQGRQRATVTLPGGKTADSLTAATFEVAR